MIHAMSSAGKQGHIWQSNCSLQACISMGDKGTGTNIYCIF